MKKMRAVVDLDSIVADFFGDHSPNGLFPLYEKRTGEKVVTDQIKSWNMTDFVSNGPELLKTFHEPGFFRNLDPLPGAVESLAILEKDFRILIASAPCTPHSAAEKIEWCTQHLPMVHHKDVWIGHNKDELRGSLLIDDGAHNAKAYRAEHPESFILTIAYPYNDAPEYDHRCGHHRDTFSAWAEILGHVHRRFGLWKAPLR